MAEIEVGKTISFRPAEYDAQVLSAIQERNPQILDTIGLIREAFRCWQLVNASESSERHRLDRIERELAEIKRMLGEWYEAHTPGKQIDK